MRNAAAKAREQKYYSANREKVIARSKAWNAVHRQPSNKKWPNLPRLRRMVDAKDYGVALSEIAERFGLANANSANASIWYARKMLERA